MKLQKLNVPQHGCSQNSLLETMASQVSEYQDCEYGSPIVLVRFAISKVFRPDRDGREPAMIGELHITSKTRLTRKTVLIVVDHFLDQVNTLYYYDPSEGWEEFDGRLQLA